MKKCPKVIIVGAGVSGIAAASRLFEEGITNVLVLEAGNRIGGRIHTVDVPGESTVIEMGAQWVHGEKDNVVFELTSFRNLLRPSNASLLDAVFVQSSGHFIPQEISDKVLNILEDVRNEVTDVKNFKSCGDYFLEKINSALENSSLNLTEELKEQLIEWFHQDVNVFGGSDTWFKSSATILTDYWRCEGHQMISWKENGYRTIFSILTEKADAILGKSFIDNYVIKNTEVVKITPHKKGIRVKCDNGKEYEADHVIVTVSLGVLKATHSNLFPTKVLSHQKLKAIENLSMGTTAKLYLKFPYQWWSKDIGELGLLWTKEDKEEYEKQGLKWITDIFSFMAVDNNPTMLCAWLAGQSAREMEKVYEPTVKRLLIHVLRKFLQKQYKIPEPNWFYRTKWKSNPLFRGSYSFKGIEADQMNVSATDLGEPIYNDDQVPVILFAGEATHAHYFGTVHGAIDTGFREANRIVSLRNSLELPIQQPHCKL